MTFWTWKWKCILNSLDWYIPTKCDYISTKMKTKTEKKKSEITHKQFKVECIQSTKFMANIQKWNHYKPNVKWIMTIILMSGLTSDQTFD
jgi:hypothetical protein